MTFTKLAFMITFLISASCASFDNEEEVGIDLSKSAGIKTEMVRFETMSGLTKEKTELKKPKYSAEWISCLKEGHKQTVLVMHSEEVGFAKNAFCSGWIAQSFLAKGYNVLAINRPGAGKSHGKPDFSGKNSMTYLQSGLTDAMKKNPKLSQPVGVWGYSIGAMSAALFAREFKNFQWMILGGGNYDLESVMNSTKDIRTRKRIQKLYSIDPDGFDFRSISYDVDGLPKNIFIYHGKKDVRYNTDQAEAFRDTLLSVEHNVKLEILQGLDHEISDGQHRRILNASIDAVSSLGK